MAEGDRFPLIERDTPVINKLKERRNGRGMSYYEKFGRDMAKGIEGDISLEEMEEAFSQFNKALAEELDEEEELIAEEITRPFSDLILEFEPEEEEESGFTLGSSDSEDEQDDE